MGKLDFLNCELIEKQGGGQPEIINSLTLNKGYETLCFQLGSLSHIMYQRCPWSKHFAPSVPPCKNMFRGGYKASLTRLSQFSE